MQPSFRIRYKLVWILIVLVLLFSAWQVWRLYQKVFAPAVSLHREDTGLLYIPTGSTFVDVCDSLMHHAWISDSAAFGWVAKRKDYPDKIKPGRYRLQDGMSLNALVNMLRAGAQEPVRLVIRSFRDWHDLTNHLASQLEPEAGMFHEALTADSLLVEVGLNSQQTMLIVIPNTYEIWWNTSAAAFARRMASEYQRFWNEDREARAVAIGLNPAEVGILASIVQEETNKRDEMARVAGVYLNRLRIGMLLQADPTVKFALGNAAIRRILFRHLEVDSPYNTYRYAGLPPGPITMPEVFTIEAVLNAEKHDYLFFCAKDDLSGYHAFARTAAEHGRNARAYQQALNRQGIY